jgi:hypothetical protein
MKLFMGFALTAVTVMGVTWMVTSSLTLLPLLLVARVLMAAALYFAVMRLLRVKMLDECMAVITSKIKHNHE